MDIFKLYRNFWDYCFENPETIKPTHIAIYSFTLEHCNRLGWKKKFGLPTTMVMEAIGVKSYNTYISALRDLVNWGFIEMIEKSKNQHSSNIVALSNFNKALDKALDKAMLKHGTRQHESTSESNSSINKPIYKETNLPITNNIEERKLKFSSTLEPYLNIYGKDLLNDFYKYWTEPNPSNTKFRKELQKTWSLERRLETWARNDKQFNNGKNGTSTTKSKAEILNDDLRDWVNSFDDLSTNENSHEGVDPSRSEFEDYELTE